MDTVRMWMTSPAITVPQTTPLPGARELLRSHRIRRLPVVDPAGQLVGIITAGDVARISGSHASDVREYNLYYRVCDLPVGEIMARPAHAVHPDTPILTVAQLRLEHKIGGVPVVEDGQVVGIITESDLFRLIVRGQLAEAWGSLQHESLARGG